MEFEVGRFTGHTNYLAGKSLLDKFCSEIDFIQNIDGNFLCTICHKYLGKDGKSHYIIIKMDDNNRILQAKEIESMCFFPTPLPAKDPKDKNNDSLATNEKPKSVIVNENQTPLEDDTGNECAMEIKIECDDDTEKNYEVDTVEITPKTEDVVAEEAEDAN